MRDLTLDYDSDELSVVALTPEMEAAIASYRSEIYATLDRDVEAALAWLDANEDYHFGHVDLIGTETSGNYGHVGRPGQVGGSAPGTNVFVDVPARVKDAPQILKAFREHFDTVNDYGSTHFILPDGTRLSHQEDTHFDAADKIGVDLYDALRAGVIRRASYGGYEAGSPITHAQADHMIDDALSSRQDSVDVDVFFPKGTMRDKMQSRASRTFSVETPAEGIRHWVNGHYAKALSAREQVRWLALYGVDGSLHLGSEKSGNYGHKGRPGQVGGSAPDGEGGDAEDDPYALHPDAPRGGEGQQALFEYAPEAGSEAALRAEAEKAVTTMDALLPDAVKNADFAGLEAKEWDDLDSDTQNTAYDKWEEDEYDSSYAQEAGDEAGDQYVRDEMSDSAVIDKILGDDNFLSWLSEHNIDERTVDVIDETELNEADVRDTDGNELSDDVLTQLKDKFRGEAEDAREALAEDLRESDGYNEAYREAQSEAIRDNWNNLNDDERYEIATNEGLVTKTEVDHEPPGTWKWDGDNDDEDYVQTRAVALELARQRTEDLFAKRGLVMETISGDPRMLVDKVAETFWHEWKGSSTSPMGIAMQMAVANEMGTLPTAHLTDQQKAFANSALVNNFTTYAERTMLGYPQASEKVPPEAEQKVITLAMGRAQAYVRAQWETTQFVMKQAGVTEVELYRAVILPKADVEKASGPQMASGVPLPKLQLLQNAVASTTNDLEVANSWSGVGENTLGKPNVERVVIRFTAPVTAAFSLPVFGENIHEESEVVLMGTKGLQWDAWRKHAPTHQSVPLVVPAPPTERVKPSLHDIVVRWDLADAKPEKGPAPIVVDMWRNTETHWLKGWRKHKARPLPKRKVVKSPHTRHSDALAQVIVRGMQKGMLPVMKKLASLDEAIAFLLRREKRK